MWQRVVVGDAFKSLNAQVIEAPNVYHAEVINAKTKANESKTKSNLAYGAVAGGAAFLLAAAGLGIYDGSFDELQSVWNVFGPIVGGVFGHYFGGAEKNNGSEKGNK